MDKKKEKVIKKRKHLIEALKNCLERNVYSQVSLENVAKEAGFSKGGLRHYFPTRESLYLALIDDFFNQIQEDHIAVLKDLGTKDKALVSTLFGLERFLLDKKNIKIFINLVLNGFEDEVIMDPIRKFIRNHLMTYQDIVRDYRKNKNDTDEEILLMGRMTQIVVLCAGLLESIDPINLDSLNLIQQILKNFDRN
ncbi:MAG TPA: TetR/AcrR family transcriptional regulator [Spirochaetota bacterium]|nr:TetR/AcrR family transcriptional regulator [Spirochaetota bacterium]HPI89208.1 TetR/AcrR family transcriptional regulator [Spirochaetota bacterium]HPR48975.1 TetR/AcrR family transcriptional regulator [Spirochaetota bacterium]